MYRRFGLKPFTIEQAFDAVLFARTRHKFSIDTKTLCDKANLALKIRKENMSLSFLKVLDQVLGDIPFNERAAYRSAIGKLWNERREEDREIAV